MDVKEAIAVAKKYINDVLADEKIGNISLEEIEFNDRAGTWSVTVGFSRPWEDDSGIGVGARLFVPRRRDSKVVRIRDADQRVISLKNREPVGE
ncbi:MAG: hypothetical protein JO254_06095 [Pseudolabrys sp.]|nr:hypothetical protein [Pseudolabrys sp.]